MVVLAVPSGRHAELAGALVDRDVPVVSASDAMADVRALLDLGPVAEARGVPLVVGAGFSPGLTCVLARHAAAELDEVDEIHVARLGTGGPACARQHHRALGGTALDWRDGGWLQRQGGSGRELCWFPDPVGAADCYRAALPDALLLVPAFPGVERVTARLAATRRDRLTARLPMLRQPHPEGGRRRGPGRGAGPAGRPPRDPHPRRHGPPRGGRRGGGRRRRGARRPGASSQAAGCRRPGRAGRAGPVPRRAGPPGRQGRGLRRRELAARALGVRDLAQSG